MYVLKETPENKFTKVRNSQRFARSANRHANKIYQSSLFFQAFKNIESTLTIKVEIVLCMR